MGNMKLIQVILGLALYVIASSGSSMSTTISSFSKLPPTDNTTISVPNPESTTAPQTITTDKIAETTASTIATQPSTRALSTEACLDIYPGCIDFFNARFCRKAVHVSWMKKNCAKSCGFCGAPCFDEYMSSVCNDYKGRGYCWRDIYKDIMREKCARTCGLCSGSTVTPPTTAPECEDTLSSYACDYYKRIGYCSQERTKRECKKTCGLCDVPNTDAQPPKTDAPPPTTDAPPPMNVTCGISSVKQQKVIGGQEATPHAWPWQVALYYHGYFTCGGSLVSPQWIVTAAHCVYGKTHYGFSVTLGAHDRSSSNGHEQFFKASNLVYHRNYNRPSSINNDIALIKLDRPVQFNKYIQPVCLPTTTQRPAVGDICYISGWGKTKHPGGSANVLHQSHLAVVDRDTCHKLNFEHNNIPVTDQMICGGYGPGNRRSGCHGDSGGPFVCQRPDGRFYLQGAVSWGSPRCHTDDAYTVFARITEFRSWIDAYLKH